MVRCEGMRLHAMMSEKAKKMFIECNFAIILLLLAFHQHDMITLIIVNDKLRSNNVQNSATCHWQSKHPQQ